MTLTRTHTDTHTLLWFSSANHGGFILGSEKQFNKRMNHRCNIVTPVFTPGLILQRDLKPGLSFILAARRLL